MGTVAPALAGAAPVHDLVPAGPEHVRHVVFRERSRSSQASGEAWDGMLPWDFSAKLDSHATAVQELIDQRLEEKLSSFQRQLQTFISQAASLAFVSSPGGSVRLSVHY